MSFLCASLPIRLRAEYVYIRTISMLRDQQWFDCVCDLSDIVCLYHTPWMHASRRGCIL